MAVGTLASSFLIALAACGGANMSAPDVELLDCQSTIPCMEFASFEKDLNGWVPRAADAGPWGVTRSKSFARDGEWAVELSGSNTTDYTKLWLQRTLRVRPNTMYTVQLEYAFCCVSYESSEPNAFFYVADARSQPAPTTDPPFQFYLWSEVPDDSSAVATPGSGGLWRYKHFTLTSRSASDGRLFVSAGLRYAFESTFRYYLDNVRLTITPRT
jgi:hypothetical protein